LQAREGAGKMKTKNKILVFDVCLGSYINHTNMKKQASETTNHRTTQRRGEMPSWNGDE